MANACQWEVYRATRAPMPSQQRQVMLCQCTPCRNARTVNLATVGPGASLKLLPATASRLTVLQWKPEPPPETEPAA